MPQNFQPSAPIISFGELLWDVFPDRERLGGAAANVAFHLAQLGRKVVLVSRVGDDARGNKARIELALSGVDVSHVQVDPEVPTGTVHVQVSDGEPKYRIGDPAAWDQLACPETLNQTLRSACALYFGTLAQRRLIAQSALDDALRQLGPHCLCICDLNLRPPFADRSAIERVLERAQVIKLNQQELARVSELFGCEDAVDWLLHQGSVSLVALTRGESGCTLATLRERVEHPGCRPSRVSDSVGAGDAFVAALIVELLRKTPLRSIALRANQYASWVVEKPGAMVPIPNAAHDLSLIDDMTSVSNL